MVHVSENLSSQRKQSGLFAGDVCIMQSEGAKEMRNESSLLQTNDRHLFFFHSSDLSPPANVVWEIGISSSCHCDDPVHPVIFLCPGHGLSPRPREPEIF